MKKSLSILAFSLVLFSSSDAALWRVNNIPGVNANFTNLPAAVSAASPGDTIYVEPSPTAYSGATISKKLIIIGNGYFHSPTPNGGINTQNAGLQANSVSSQINSIDFYPGSEFSVLMGCFIGYGGHVMVYTSDITVKRNYIWNYLYINNYHPTLGTYQALNNLDVRQNVMGSGVATFQFSTSGGGAFNNVSIQNNVFFGSSISLPVGVQGFIQNNFINGNLNVYNFQINNNILIAGSFVPNNTVYFNNIGSGTQFGNANGNQQNITTTALFTNYTNTTENRYILSPTGPGVGTGFNGVDVGPFGGPDPYKQSGIPPFPTVYSLSAPSTTTTSTLPVTISTRSNN